MNPSAERGRRPTFPLFPEDDWSVDDIEKASGMTDEQFWEALYAVPVVATRPKPRIERGWTWHENVLRRLVESR